MPISTNSQNDTIIAIIKSKHPLAKQMIVKLNDATNFLNQNQTFPTNYLKNLVTTDLYKWDSLLSPDSQRSWHDWIAWYFRLDNIDKDDDAKYIMTTLALTNFIKDRRLTLSSYLQYVNVYPHNTQFKSDLQLFNLLNHWETTLINLLENPIDPLAQLLEKPIN